MAPERNDETVPTEHERDISERVESVLRDTECLREETQKYPVRGEELATEYAEQEIDLPNETESLGSVFDRLTDQRYDSSAEAREAVLNELTGEEAGMEEYNDQRSIEQLAEDTSAAEAVETERYEKREGHGE